MTRILNNAVKIIALLMFAYHMVFTLFPLQNPVLHVNTHLMFALVLTYIAFAEKGEKKLWRSILLLAAVLSLVATTYVHVLYDELAIRSFFNTTPDLVIGVILIVLSIEATRRGFGWLIPGIVIGAVLYPFIGRLLPEPFYATSYPLKQVISNLSLSFTHGLHGMVLYSSANYIYLFIVFGAVLQASGATNFFMDLGKLVANKFKGGPAMMSVISSAGVGSISGSVVANMSITGAFTIPLMKSVGYTPEQAGGIEAAASNGGQILPPVMGVTAFFMAGYTGIPYVQICAMALIPALLYYLNVGTYVYLQAAKQGIGTTKADVNKRELLLSAPTVIAPFAVIVWLLMIGKSVMFVAFFAIITVVVVSLIRKKTRPSLGAMINGFVEGSKSGAQIGAMVAALGLMLSTITMSGMAVKLGAGIQMWSGGNMLFAMLIIWALAVLMGLVGMALVAYLIVSMFVISGLVKFGIPFETAHFFVFFPAVFGGMTPPVAVFALIASKMAQSNYMKTATEAIKMAGIGLILPFMFVSSPTLLLNPRSPVDAVTTIVAAIVLILSSQIAFSGYLMIRTSLRIRLLFMLTAAAAFAFLPSHYYLLPWQSYLLFAAALIVFVLLAIYQRRRSRALELLPEGDSG